MQKKSFVEIKLKPQTEETVYVSHIDDMDNIYCQLTKHEDSLYKCEFLPIFGIQMFYYSLHEI